MVHTMDAMNPQERQSHVVIETKLRHKSLDFRVGRAVFKVIPSSGDGIYPPARGVRVVEDYTHNKNGFGRYPERSEAPLPGVVLRPGETLQIGRTDGIQIFDDWGNVDEIRKQNIDDGTLGQALRSDLTISRDHARLHVIGNTYDDHVILEDLGSLNGTHLV